MKRKIVPGTVVLNGIEVPDPLGHSYIPVELHGLEFLETDYAREHRRLRVFVNKGVKCAAPECTNEGAYVIFGKDRHGEPNIHRDLYTKDFIMMTIDHIVAKRNGGKDTLSNLQPMCQVCNSDKAHKKIRICITGGIGSGKSTICKEFEKLGVPVLYTDLLAKELENSNPELGSEIIKVFGEHSYYNGVFNTAYMGPLVFSDEEKLKKLTDIVKPYVVDAANKWSNRQKTSYTIEESAIVFETNGQDKFDYIIGVYANEKTRVQRVMNRNSLAEKEVLDRIDKQMNEEEKMLKCDYIIQNNGDDTYLDQILYIHKYLSKGNLPLPNITK